MFLSRNLRLTTIAFILFLVVLAGYAYLTSRSLTSGPQITITSPESGETYTEQFTEIVGNTQNVAEISLGGRKVFLTEEGRFRERLLLAPGYNLLEFEARDRFGRATKEELELVYIQ